MLIGKFEYSLVLVSVLVAMLASYTALSMAASIATSRGRAAAWWIAGGALAMGTGIWSMHFIGMLAFRLPIPVGYDPGITLLSFAIPVLVSGIALWQVSRPQLPASRLAAGALLIGIGIGIAAMHYTGMVAMRMQPPLRYDPLLFSASIATAVGAAGAALWIAFRLRMKSPHAWLPRAGAAAVMGIAIAGMHYLGMAAANFAEGSVCSAANKGFSQDGLAILVTVATLALLGIALMASNYDTRLKVRSRVLAISQAIAEERQVLLVRERNARAEAERMSAIKDEFLATLSHELRTPLNSILGWSQILLRGAKDEATLRKGLDTIEPNARAQAQLIEDLLDMSRILSGKVHLNMQQADPLAAIEAALETARPAAMAKHIRLETAFDRNVGMLCADVNRLQQVMWNLLSNAVKFTPDGGMVKVSLKRSGKQIAITVADTGIGIPPRFLPHVFDRFRQADASTTRRYGGLGLGLSIVRSLVEMQDGTVGVTSAGEGKGAAFTVRLPLAQAQAQADATAERATQADASLRAADLSGAKVLVVDDQADARELVENLLTECNAEVLTAADVRQALALVRDERPQVLLSDIGMPDVDGFELLERIRALGREQGGDLPAIALTAFTRAEDRWQAEQAGFAFYLSKPVDPFMLISSIAHAMSVQDDGRRCPHEGMPGSVHAGSAGLAGSDAK